MAISLDQFLAQMLSSDFNNDRAQERQASTQNFQREAYQRQRRDTAADWANREILGYMNPEKFTFSADAPADGGVALYRKGPGASGDENLVHALAQMAMMRAKGEGESGGKGSPFKWERPDTRWNEERGRFEVDPYNSGMLDPWQIKHAMNAGGFDQVRTLAEQLYEANRQMGTGMLPENAAQQAFQTIYPREKLAEFYRLGEVEYDPGAVGGRQFVDRDDRRAFAPDRQENRGWWQETWDDIADVFTAGQQDRWMNRPEAISHYRKRYGIDPGLAAYYLDLLPLEQRESVQRNVY